jgi:hypothetical protein
MAELGFQVSTKTNDGTIFVIADATYGGFTAKLSEALGQSGAENLLNNMASAFDGGPQPMSIPEVANALGATVIQPQQWGNQAPSASGSPVCKHGEQAKLVPAGTSKTSGKAYRAFYACQRPQGQQCDFRANAS